MGATKVLQVALGRSESDEVRTNIHLLSEKLKGHAGLFCTSLSKEEVRGGVTPNQIIPIINGETNEPSEGGGGERAQRRGYTIW